MLIVTKYLLLLLLLPLFLATSLFTLAAVISLVYSVLMGIFLFLEMLMGILSGVYPFAITLFINLVYLLLGGIGAYSSFKLLLIVWKNRYEKSKRMIFRICFIFLSLTLSLILFESKIAHPSKGYDGVQLSSALKTIEPTDFSILVFILPYILLILLHTYLHDRDLTDSESHTVSTQH